MKTHVPQPDQSIELREDATIAEKMARKSSGEYIVTPEGKKKLRSFNIHIGDKRTTVRLSPVARQAIEKIAELENCKTGIVFDYIYRTKENGVSTATAIRDFAFKYFMEAATHEGHLKAGHGRLIKEQEQPWKNP